MQLDTKPYFSYVIQKSQFRIFQNLCDVDNETLLTPVQFVSERAKTFQVTVCAVSALPKIESLRQRMKPKFSQIIIILDFAV